MKPSELAAMGLDPRVPSILEGWGIEELYPPQAEALPVVLEGGNVVVAIPTASGKSMIAHVALVQGALKGGKGIYIVPLKALAQEKYEELSSFSDLGINVGMSVGDLDRIEDGLDNYDILVTTSEKADSILRHRDKWGASMSVIVADEVHLVHDDHRGPTMEVLLARLRQLNPSVQVVALSATIRNAREMAEWLDAKLIESDWRPVKLKEGVYSQGRIWFPNGEEKEVPRDMDPIPSMAKQMIDEGGQFMVFVGTRKSAESTARNLASLLELKEGVHADVDEDEDVGLHKKLRWCLERGVAFHHAGLGSSYRRTVEKGFREGVIKCIAATPTLAAGINLPARRVVVRDLKRYDSTTGSRYLPVLFVKQACGRAGRPHLDPYGEAVLMARSDAEAEHLMEIYILGESEDIVSKLGNESILRRHLLGLIASGACLSRDAVNDFLATTFFACQKDLWEIDEAVERSMDFLIENGFVEEGEEEQLKATLLGRRTSDLYLDPLTALNYRTAVESGKEPGLIGVLQALSSSPDMIKLYTTKKDLQTLDEYAAVHEEDFLLPVPDDEIDFAEFLRELKTAKMLEDWIDEVEEEEMSKRYGVGPGDIHNRVETAKWLLHGMEAIASLFTPTMVPIIRKVSKRVQYGVQEELLDLVRIRNVGRKRARILLKAGYKSGRDIAQADPVKLAGLPGFGPRIAEKITGKTISKGAAKAEAEVSKDGQQTLGDF